METEKSMKKIQLRAELFRIKSRLSEALIAEAGENGTESEFWKAVHEIWSEMNQKTYR